MTVADALDVAIEACEDTVAGYAPTPKQIFAAARLRTLRDRLKEEEEFHRAALRIGELRQQAMTFRDWTIVADDTDAAAAFDDAFLALRAVSKEPPGEAK